VSSEKPETRVQSLERRRRVEASGVVTVTAVGGGYRALHESLMVIIRLANSANLWRFRTCGRLSVENTLLKWLAYNLKHMALEFGSVVSALKPVMGQGHQFRGKAAGCKRHVPEILLRPFEKPLRQIQLPAHR
jgi:hypothetical protein